MSSLVEWRRASGATILAGDYRVTPESRAVVVRLPFGALVWNRAIAVAVEHAGRVDRVRIHDVTRIAQVLLLGFTMGLWIVVRRGPVSAKEGGS